MTEFYGLINQAKPICLDGHGFLSSLCNNIESVYEFCKEIMKGEIIEQDNNIIDQCFDILMGRMNEEMILTAVEYYLNRKNLLKLAEILKSFNNAEYSAALIKRYGMITDIDNPVYFEMIYNIFAKSETFQYLALPSLCRMCSSLDFIEMVDKMSSQGSLNLSELECDSFDGHGNVWDYFGFLLCKKLRVKDYFQDLLEIAREGTGIFYWYLARQTQRKSDRILPAYLEFLGMINLSGARMELIACCEDILDGKASVEISDNEESLIKYGVSDAPFRHNDYIQELVCKNITWMLSHNVEYFTQKYEIYQDLMECYSDPCLNPKQTIINSVGYDYLKALIYIKAEKFQDAYYSLLKIQSEPKAIMLIYQILSDRGLSWRGIADNCFRTCMEMGCGKAFAIQSGVHNLKKAIDLGYYQAIEELVRICRESSHSPLTPSELAAYYEKSMNARSGIKLGKSSHLPPPPPFQSNIVYGDYSYLCTGFCTVQTRMSNMSLPLWVFKPYDKLISLMKDSTINLVELENLLLNKDEGAEPIIHYIVSRKIIKKPSLSLIQLASALDICDFVRDAITDQDLVSGYMTLVDIGRHDEIEENDLAHLVSLVMSTDFSLPRGREIEFTRSLLSSDKTIPAFIKCMAELGQLIRRGIRLIGRRSIGELSEIAKNLVNDRVFDTHSIGSENTEFLSSYGIVVNGPIPFKEGINVDLWIHLRDGVSKQLIGDTLQVSMKKMDKQLVDTYCITFRRRRGMSCKLDINMTIVQASHKKEYRNLTLDMDYSSSMERHVYISTSEWAIDSVYALISYSSVIF